jgi:uncharacterized protein YeaO (DUF488 family)
MVNIHVKRVYEPREESDGFRILVDRLWPRGIKKEAANVDAWIKEVAPSNELRKWFHTEHDKWNEFVEKYEAELKNSEAVKGLKDVVKKNKTVTFLYSSKFTEHNNAVALRDFIKTNK